MRAPAVERSIAERRAGWLLGIGFALLVGPMVTYPGNWTYAAPASASAEAAWTTLAAVDFVLVGTGGIVALLGWRALLRSWTDYPVGSLRRSVRDALALRSARFAMGLSAAAYVVLVGAFLSLYGWSSGGLGLWADSYPSATNVLCCGGMGQTPVAILILTPTIELVIFPLVLVTIFVATLLFSMNMGVATALFSSRSMSSGLGGASAGAAGALLVNCPTCGTILLENILVGTSAAGLLVAWAAYSVPIMLVSFPISLLTLVWSARRLSRVAARPRCPVASLPP